MTKKNFIALTILLIVISLSQLLDFLSNYYDLINFWWDLLSATFYFLILGFWIISKNKNIWNSTFEAIISSSLLVCISSVFIYLISFKILGGSFKNIVHDNLGQMVHIYTLVYYPYSKYTTILFFKLICQILIKYNLISCSISERFSHL